MLLILLWLSPFQIAKLYGERTAAVFSICVAGAPHFLHYGVEIRPYSWGLFFATAVGVFALQILSSNALNASKYYIGLAIFTLLSGYTHQYALIPAAYLWLFLLIFIVRLTENRRAALKASLIFLAATAALYIPMLILTFYQLKRASGYFSMEALSLSSFLADLRFPYVTNVTPLSLLLLIGVLALLVLTVSAALRQKRFIIPIALFSCLYLTLILGYIVSAIAGESLFTARYLVPSLGLFWLGLSIMATDPEAPFSMIRERIFIALMLISLIAVYPQEFREEYASGVNKMTEYFDSNLNVDDGYIIYEDKYQIELCMRYYYPSLKKYDWENADECRGKLWYFEVAGYEDFLEKAAEYGYKYEFISNMKFDRYSFALYSLNPVSED